MLRKETQRSKVLNTCAAVVKEIGVLIFPEWNCIEVDIQLTSHLMIYLFRD